MIPCYIKDLETSTEKIFEIHTIDYPDIQFNLNLREESLSITEQARVKNGNQSTIQFLLKITSVPIECKISNYRLVVSPTNEQIQPLIIPVVCYRTNRQANAENPSVVSQRVSYDDDFVPIVSPICVSLGVIRSGEAKRFQVSMDTGGLGPTKISEITCVAKDVTVDWLPNVLPDETQTIIVQINASALSGLIDGRIGIVFSNGQSTFIEITGIVVPNSIRNNNFN